MSKNSISHFVTAELDAGPIIAQDTVSIDNTLAVADMVKIGQDIEKAVLAKALSLVLTDKVFVTGNKTVVLS